MWIHPGNEAITFSSKLSCRCKGRESAGCLCPECCSTSLVTLLRYAINSDFKNGFPLNVMQIAVAQERPHVPMPWRYMSFLRPGAKDLGSFIKDMTKYTYSAHTVYKAYSNSSYLDRPMKLRLPFPYGKIYSTIFEFLDKLSTKGKEREMMSSRPLE